jgi:hypothetical protein
MGLNSGFKGLMAMFFKGTVKNKCALTSRKLGILLRNIYKILGRPKTKTYTCNFFFARDAYGHNNDFNILRISLTMRIQSAE